MDCPLHCHPFFVHSIDPCAACAWCVHMCQAGSCMSVSLHCMLKLTTCVAPGRQGHGFQVWGRWRRAVRMLHNCTCMHYADANPASENCAIVPMNTHTHTLSNNDRNPGAKKKNWRASSGSQCGVNAILHARFVDGPSMYTN